MKQSETTVKVKKPHKIVKTILKILGIILAIILILILILSIRHHILSKRDRAFAADAYGEFYTTPQGVRMNYTVIENGAADTAVILPGYGCPTVRYEFDSLPFLNAICQTTARSCTVCWIQSTAGRTH